MPAVYELKKIYDGAFTVDKELLEEIIEIANSYTGTVATVLLSTRGEEHVRSELLSDVLSDVGIIMSPIKQIQITSDNYKTNPTKHFAIDFGHYDSDEILVVFKGLRIDIASPAQAIDARVRAATLPYHSFYRLWTVKNAAVCAIICLLVAEAVRAEYSLLYSSAFIEILFSAGFAIAALFTLGLIKLALDTAFPPILFNIGRSAVTYRCSRMLLSFIFGTIVTGAIVGWLVNKVSAHW